MSIIRTVLFLKPTFTMQNPRAIRGPSTIVNRTVTPRRPRNVDLREREYLTPKEVERLQDAARKHSRYGHRDATAILIAYRHGLRAFVRSIFEAIVDIFDDLGLKRDQPRVRLPPPCTSKVLLKGWHFDPDAGPLKRVVENRANATGGEDFAWDNKHRGTILLCPVLQGDDLIFCVSVFVSK